MEIIAALLAHKFKLLIGFAISAAAVSYTVVTQTQSKEAITAPTETVLSDQPEETNEMLPNTVQPETTVLKNQVEKETPLPLHPPVKEVAPVNVKHVEQEEDNAVEVSDNQLELLKGKRQTLLASLSEEISKSTALVRELQWIQQLETWITQCQAKLPGTSFNLTEQEKTDLQTKYKALKDDLTEINKIDSETKVTLLTLEKAAEKKRASSNKEYTKYETEFNKVNTRFTTLKAKNSYEALSQEKTKLEAKLTAANLTCNDLDAVRLNNAAKLERNRK